MTLLPDRDSSDGGEQRVVTARPLTAIEKRMAEDLRWAATAPEVRQHAGQVVAVWNQRIVGLGTDRQTLRRQAAAREGCLEGEIVCIVVPSLDLSETPR